jgi:hypothetical protein
MIPHGLHIGAKPAEVIGRLVTEPADEGIAGLIVESETGEAKRYGSRPRDIRSVDWNSKPLE